MTERSYAWPERATDDKGGSMSDPHRWRSPLLGTPVTLTLPAGHVEYFRRGRGPALVFTHGWLSNANLWRHVVDALADRFLCVTLDLPFGAHRVPLREDAELTPAACGQLITHALKALALGPVTLIGNDSGGAYSQIAVATAPACAARLVLTNGETLYDPFPPPPFDGLPAAADGEGLGALLAALRDPAVRQLPAAFGWLSKHPIDAAVSDSYALPCLEDPAILRDVRKAMRTAASAPVHAAGRRLIAEFRKPVLFAWATEDPVFPIAHAERYAAALADARVVRIADSYSFIGEDQPRELAAALAAFAG
jgi:pimeloyl-ACP methyl ester carboxylesterase